MPSLDLYGIIENKFGEQVVLIVKETPNKFRVQPTKGRRLRLPYRKNGVTAIDYPGTTLINKSKVRLA